MKEEVKCTYCKRLFLVDHDVVKNDKYIQCTFCVQIFKNPFYKEKKEIKEE